MSRLSSLSAVRHSAADATDRFDRIMVGVDGSPQCRGRMRVIALRPSGQQIHTRF